MDILGLVLIPHLLPLAADAVDSPVSWLVNYGVAGIVILLLVTGQLRTKAEVASIQKIADERAQTNAEYAQAIKALTEAVMRVLPSLSNVSAVVEALPQTAETQLIDRLAELTAKLESIERNRMA